MTVETKSALGLLLGAAIKRFVPSRVLRKLTPIVNILILSGVGVATGQDPLTAAAEGALAGTLATGAHSGLKNAYQGAKIMRR